MDKSKPFGLIISKRAATYKPPASAVFGSDSDEEKIPKSKKPSIPQAKPKKRNLPEASADPSIYEYDSIYDDMKAQEVAKVAPKDVSKPSRYIESLLKAADKRKKDQERRVEKKVQHERELEGDKFADKEAFVTSAYKKKMQEMEEEEERERRENMMNEMMDVTKQKDLSGFYRHFLKQSVGEEKIPVFGERHAAKTDDVVVKQENLSDEEGSSQKTDKDHKRKNKDRDDENSDVEQPKKRPSYIKDRTKRDLASEKEESKKLSSEHRTKDLDSSGEGRKWYKEPKEEVISDESSKDQQSNKESDPVDIGKFKRSSTKVSKGARRQRRQDTDSEDEREESLSKIVTKKVSPGDNVDRDTDMESSSDEESADKSSKDQKSSKDEYAVGDNVDQDSDIVSSSDEDSGTANKTRDKMTKMEPHKSKDLEDNHDKDSDIASDSDDKSSRKRKRTSNKNKPTRNIRQRVEDGNSSAQSDESSNDEKPLSKEDIASDDESNVPKTDEKTEKEPPKPKIDIYAKRTVGDVFAEAQARYFQRMAARSA